MAARAAHRPSAQTCRSPAAGRQPIELSPRDLLQRFQASRGPTGGLGQVVVLLVVSGQVVVPLAIPGQLWSHW